MQGYCKCTLGLDMRIAETSVDRGKYRHKMVDDQPPETKRVFDQQEIALLQGRGWVPNACRAPSQLTSIKSPEKRRQVGLQRLSCFPQKDKVGGEPAEAEAIISKR